MRLILDTSVLISVLVSRGKSYSRDIIKLASKNEIKLITCKETFTELRTALKSNKIKKLINYNSSKIGIFIAWYKYNSQFISISTENRAHKSSRDLKDNIFLQLAEKSKADYLLTLDDDILILKEIGSTKIQTPEEFISLFF